MLHNTLVIWMTLGFALLVAGAAVAARLLALAGGTGGDDEPDPAVRLEARVRGFLHAHPGPLELRPLALWRPIVTLAAPRAADVIALAREAAAEDGVELWQISPGAVAHLVLPPLSPRPESPAPPATRSRSRRVC